MKLDDFVAVGVVVVGKTSGIESPRCITSHFELFIWIWINAVVLSSVDDEDEDEDEELVALDDEQDKNGRLCINIADVDGTNESFSIWLRLKSEKCLSIVDFNGIIAGGNDGSARTTCRKRGSFLTVALNGSGDDDNIGFKDFFNTGWCGKERRANGVRRMYGDETVLLTPPVLGHLEDGDEKFLVSS